MIRILQCVNDMHRAGLETVLMNYYRNVDRSKIQFDFLMHRPERSDYDDEIESLGGRIYRAPRLYPQNYPAYFAFMRRFFKEHPEYRIIHSHIDSMSYFPLLAAKKAGIPVRIAHSHSTSIDLGLKYPLKQLFRFLLDTVLTHRFSCGQAAGKFLFRGHDFLLIPNAIDAEKFFYNEDVRNQTRQDLGLEGKMVIGHVGRFTAVKNHAFLLRTFAQVLEAVPNSVLLLAGTGELEQKIREMADKLEIAEHVVFLGNRSDTHRLYQAMDVFVMPSIFEGVPLVGIEAQFSGVPCLLSDSVSPEVGFAQNCHFLDLNLGTGFWAEEIVRQGKLKRGGCVSGSELYDMKYAHQHLEEAYVELSHSTGGHSE